jgi:hypothetical protein
MIAAALAFALAGCDGETDGPEDPDEPVNTDTPGSISTLRAWLNEQPDNTAATPYKVSLSDVNLDSGTNWADLGVALNETGKYIDLDLSGCTATAIPEGRLESKYEGSKLTVTFYGTFVGCNRLVAIKLPKGVKTIGRYTFYECGNLASVSLPDNLTEIHGYAFRFGKALKSISLPNGLKVIEEGAFEETGLTSVTIPASVRGFKHSAFRLSALKTVVVEEGVDSISELAFSHCYSLESIKLPNSIRRIGDSSLAFCSSLESITIPAGVTSMGHSVFEQCSKLKEVTMLPVTPPAIGTSVFLLNYSGYDDDITIRVPAASVNAYKTAYRWSAYADKIVSSGS